MKSAYHHNDSVTLYHGDALAVASTLDAGAADCIVTSPPYFGLRDYGTAGQYGLEASPAEYVETMRALFAELRRVLADDGTLWLNLGDSYSKNKSLLGVPWRVAFALQDDGWILRNAIVWHKTNAMPQSVTDRLSGRYEHVFMFSKSRRYWFNLDPIREPHTAKPQRRFSPQKVDKTPRPEGVRNQTFAPVLSDEPTTYGHPLGRNPGDVWTITTQPFPGAHFATFPQELPRRCITAGCKPGGTVLDPFHGSGTTGLVATQRGRKYVGIDISAEYLDLSLSHPKRLLSSPIPQTR